MLLLTILMVMAVSCSQDATEPEPRSAPTPAASSPQREGPNSNARFDAAEIDLELQPVASGLSGPLGVTHAGDGSGRLFVLEQGGVVRIIRDGELQAQPFLSITDRITAGGEQGLLGLAFHPAYEDNGRFFVNYTDTEGDTVVARYEADPQSDSADPGSEEVLLRIEQPFENHNGGHLAFGPDGHLYVATGDGGSAGDPEDNGQDKEALLGKLLRIDVDGSRYEAPTDNPFADGGGAPEVWAYGLRNPWRFSFDEAAGTLWIGDVGQNALEEINRVPMNEAGLNFGWNEMEGSRCYEGDCDRSGKVLPVTEYGHDAGCSVTGGFVYRGRQFRDLRGGYFFGDFCSGSIWVIPADAEGPIDPNLVLTSDHAISSFGLDEDGELYVTDIGSGDVLRMTDAS